MIKLRLLLVLILHITAPLTLQAANLITVIVADTADESIGSSTAADFQKVRAEAQKISSYTGLRLKEVTLKGKDVRPAVLLRKMEQLRVNEDDVVFFYFSGHGYRTSDKEGNPWPNLFFSLVSEGIDFSFVAKELQEKKPRLLLLLADVCNSFVPDAWAPPLVYKAFGGAAPDQEVIKANYRSLFLETSGTVMITSSEVGEYSYATPEGGLFTLEFLKSLNKAVKSTEYPDWELILGESSINVAPDQHPIWNVIAEVN